MVLNSIKHEINIILLSCTVLFDEWVTSVEVYKFLSVEVSDSWRQDD